MRIPRFAVPIFIAQLIAPIFSIAQSQGTAGAAYGTVFLAMNQKPVEHAQVDFRSLSSDWEGATLSGSDGKFDLAGLPLGQYRLTVSAPTCERYEAVVSIAGRTGPLSLPLTKSPRQPTPVADSVISVDELKTKSGKVESAFKKGTELLQKGDARRSLTYFKRAVAKDPNYYRAYHNLGLAQYLLGELAPAAQAFQRAIDLTNGGFAPSEFALSMILIDQQQFRQAEAVIRRGLVMDPSSAQGEYLLALVQFASERLLDAERSANDTLFRSANQAEAYILLAEIHTRRHEPHAVEADVAAYLKLDSHGPLVDKAYELLQRAQMDISNGADGTR
jgi:tetratricopeptide (TPR) repeat protein